jgi:kynureninase
VTSLKEGFSRFLGSDPSRLHAAAHSHHPWPDVTHAAHQQAWLDSARLMDDKWDHVFGVVFPAARSAVARVLALPARDTLVFAPNTHEFILRIASNLPVPLRILTSDAEFHSFSRQVARWEEAGMATVDRIPAEPFASFPERFVEGFSSHELVFLSHVHFNSGYVVPDLDALVSALPDKATIVIDGYHGFMAVPTDLSRVAERAFYLAGGYKYAMAGEGAAFLHVPPGAPARPVNTGWWAGFGALTEAPDGVPYAEDGRRFAGATADPSGIYRLRAVLEWLDGAGVTVADIHAHVGGLQQGLLELLESDLAESVLPPADAPDRGHFLTFRRTEAADLYRRAHERGVITDYRGDRWRVGLGIYHDQDDVDRLADVVNSIL